MNRESMKQLRLDRRLMNRQGWISQKDLQGELEALPDVSDKVAPADDESDDRTAAPSAGETATEGV